MADPPIAPPFCDSLPEEQPPENVGRMDFATTAEDIPSCSADVPSDPVASIQHVDESGLTLPAEDKNSLEQLKTDQIFNEIEGLDPAARADRLKEYDPAEPLLMEDLLEKDESAVGVEVMEGVNPGVLHEDLAVGVLDFMKGPPEEDDGTLQEQMDFVQELERFFIDRKMEYKHPKFYGENLNCLKLWRTVVRLGGYESVTSGKLWRQVGETFNPPKKCTTVSWSFRGFYEKALLDYERYKLHGICPSAGQGASQYDTAQMIEGPSNAALGDASQACASYMPNLGRARRNAASRAMQGWHSQRFLDSGEVGDPIIKDRSSTPAKRDKQLKMGLLKRKKASTLERAVQAARIKGARPHFQDFTGIKHENCDDVGSPLFTVPKKKTVKQEHAKQVLKSSNNSLFNGTDVWVIDEGPRADWVKINVHRTLDCFEVYALVPGLLREEVRVQCEPGGQLVITGEPEQPNNPWGVTSFKKVINLPLPIDANQTSAVVTHHGQLFVRVPYGQTPS